MKPLSDFITNFLNIYQTLTVFQKKIFKYLQWFSKKFRCVFPCLQKIANAIGSCVRTVTRATKYFQDLGWIYKKKRGYQSNLYFMNDELIDLNLDDKSLFFREKCPDNVHVLESSSSDSIDTSIQEGKVPIYENMENKEIPHILKIRCLSIDDRQRLANRFSEYALYQSIEDAKWYAKMGNKIKNYLALIWSGAKRYS